MHPHCAFTPVLSTCDLISQGACLHKVCASYSDRVLFAIICVSACLSFRRLASHKFRGSLTPQIGLTLVNLKTHKHRAGEIPSTPANVRKRIPSRCSAIFKKGCEGLGYTHDSFDTVTTGIV